MAADISVFPSNSRDFFNTPLKQPLFFALGIIFFISSLLAGQYLSENSWKDKWHLTLLVIGSGFILAGLCFYYDCKKHGAFSNQQG